MSYTVNTPPAPNAGAESRSSSSDWFGAFLVRAPRAEVGHIWCASIDRTLCNVEARVKPWTNTELDHMGDEFPDWHKRNANLICKRCAAKFAALPNAKVCDAGGQSQSAS